MVAISGSLLLAGFAGFSLAPSALENGCTPAPANLIAWWPAEDNTNDIVGHNNGTYNGSPAYTVGKVGQSFALDGASYISVPNAANLSLTGELTIDAWVMPTANNAYMHIVSKRDSNNFNVSYEVFVNVGTLGFAKKFSGANESADSGIVIPLNTWSHIAVTISDTTLTFYVNGVANGPFIIGARPTTSDVLTIGDAHGSFGDVEFWTGRLDEIELFDRALSGTEIAAIYAADSAGKCRSCATPPNGMISWWPGDGNYHDIQDGNNGAPIGSVGFGNGQVGSAFSFNGNGQINIGNPPNLDLTGTAVSLDAWINPSSSGQTAMIAGKTLSGFNDYVLYLDNGGLRAGLKTDVQEYFVAGDPPALNQWTHVAMTYDGNFFRL